jgi:hypothetical protein
MILPDPHMTQELFSNLFGTIGVLTVLMFIAWVFD